MIPCEFFKTRGVSMNLYYVLFCPILLDSEFKNSIQMHFCNLENTELGCKWKGGGCDNYDTEMTEFDEAVEKMKKGI